MGGGMMGGGGISTEDTTTSLHSIDSVLLTLPVACSWPGACLRDCGITLRTTMQGQTACNGLPPKYAKMGDRICDKNRKNFKEKLGRERYLDTVFRILAC